jgi:hypothetical protein
VLLMSSLFCEKETRLIFSSQERPGGERSQRRATPG